MATTRPKHSGFEAPGHFTKYPKGTTLKKNKDGTMSAVLPKEKNSNNKGKKK